MKVIYLLRSQRKGEWAQTQLGYDNFPQVKVWSYFSPMIHWQVSWCIRFIVFNLHSQVAYQATDGKSEMKMPHISSNDCASHSVWYPSEHVTDSAGSAVLCRDFLETVRHWGSLCEACTVFPACSKVIVRHSSRQTWLSHMHFHNFCSVWGDVPHNLNASSLLVHDSSVESPLLLLLLHAVPSGVASLVRVWLSDWCADVDSEASAQPPLLSPQWGVLLWPRRCYVMLLDRFLFPSLMFILRASVVC